MKIIIAFKVCMQLSIEDLWAHSFQQVVGYRNLDRLTSLLDLHSYRVLKKDCLDLPDKLYTARYVSLTENK